MHMHAALYLSTGNFGFNCAFFQTGVCFGTFYAFRHFRLRFGAGSGAPFAAAAEALSILDATCFM